MKTPTRPLALIALLAAAAVFTVTCGDSPTASELPEPVCGGFEGIPCQTGQFCQVAEGQCQTADLFGECVPVPQACTQEFVPVCGCDGVTYGNDCIRRMARVQKDRNGEC